MSGFNIKFNIDPNVFEKYKDEAVYNKEFHDDGTKMINLVKKITEAILNKHEIILSGEDCLLAMEMWLTCREEFLQRKSRVLIWSLGIVEKATEEEQKIKLDQNLYAIALTIPKIIKHIMTLEIFEAIMIGICFDICQLPLSHIYEASAGKRLSQLLTMSQELEKFTGTPDDKVTVN